MLAPQQNKQPDLPVALGATCDPRCLLPAELPSALQETAGDPPPKLLQQDKATVSSRSRQPITRRHDERTPLRAPSRGAGAYRLSPMATR